MNIPYLSRNTRKVIAYFLVSFAVLGVFCDRNCRRTVLAEIGHEGYKIEDQKVQRDVKSKDGTILLKCKLIYPQIIDPCNSSKFIDVVNKSIESQAVKEYSKRCEDVREYIKEAEGEITSGTINRDLLPYSFEYTYTMTLNHKDYISFYYTDYEWFGGAHPSTTIDGFSYDMNSGKGIAAKDLLKINETGIKTYIAEQAAELYQKNPEAYFEEEIKNLKNLEFEYGFYLNQDGIVFYFEPYMIAPYATGIVTIELRYTEHPDFFIDGNPFRNT